MGTLGHLCPLPAPHPPLSLGALGMAGEKKREGLDAGAQPQPKHRGVILLSGLPEPQRPNSTREL